MHKQREEKDDDVDYMPVLAALLNASASQQPLLIDRDAARWLAQLPEGATLLAAQNALSALADSGRFDFALLVDALDALPRRKAEQLLASLRDVHCSHFLVVLPPDSAWTQVDLFAFGLQKVPQAQLQRGGWQLYGYDIYNYKRSPDWLNAKHWANPQLWDEYRW